MLRGKPALRHTAPWLLLALGSLPAGGGTGTATRTLSATVSPVGALNIPATATLSKGSNSFQPFAATVPVNYQVRTTPAGSGGSITLKVASDFSPTGGPAAASGDLTYVCSGANLGTACSGTQTASTATSTPVLTVPASACTGGGGSCSSQNPNSMSLTFTLIDSPVYPTGTYSANITFTISAM
jgi:hypothetical protein